jgi:hypothetical protein
MKKQQVIQAQHLSGLLLFVPVSSAPLTSGPVSFSFGIPDTINMLLESFYIQRKKIYIPKDIHST